MCVRVCRCPRERGGGEILHLYTAFSLRYELILVLIKLFFHNCSTAIRIRLPRASYREPVRFKYHFTSLVNILCTGLPAVS